MPARRKPEDQHRAAGSYRSDRHDVEATPLRALPARAPAHFDEAQKRAWRDLARAGELHLTAGDAVAVELASCLLARLRTGKATAAECSSLAGLLSKLGLEPQARQHVRMRGSPPKKPKPGVPVVDPAHRYGLT